MWPCWRKYATRGLSFEVLKPQINPNLLSLLTVCVWRCKLSDYCWLPCFSTMIDSHGSRTASLNKPLLLSVSGLGHVLLSQQQPSHTYRTQSYQSLEQCKSKPQWEVGSHWLRWLLAREKDVSVVVEKSEPCAWLSDFDSWVFTKESWEYISQKNSWGGYRDGPEGPICESESLTAGLWCENSSESYKKRVLFLPQGPSFFSAEPPPRCCSSVCLAMALVFLLINSLPTHLDHCTS